MRLLLPTLALLFFGLHTAACADAREAGAEPEPVTLAATTTLDDSGLLAELTRAFHAVHPEYRIRTLVAGTGEALALGRRGDADVVLSHDPAAESLFVAAGHGTERRELMQNDFVIAGPTADPAGVRGARDAAAALRRISGAEAAFVSRGDDSGTHRKEQALWRESGVSPVPSRWPGYTEAGVGMGEALRVASERGAYILTDRATLLTLGEALALEVLVEGDPRLLNRYGVVRVRGSAQETGARALVEWLTSPGGQAVIGSYGAGLGTPLFHPAARTGG